MPKTGILDQVVDFGYVFTCKSSSQGESWVLCSSQYSNLETNHLKGGVLNLFCLQEDLFALDMPHVLVIDFPKRSILINM